MQNVKGSGGEQRYMKLLVLGSMAPSASCEILMVLFQQWLILYGCHYDAVAAAEQTRRCKKVGGDWPMVPLCRCCAD